MRASRDCALVLGLSLAMGCGAKSGLSVPGSDAGPPPSATQPPPELDAQADAREPTRPGRPDRPRADKIDLVLLIDDSGSMGDKQDILARAVPDMVRRLTSPLCVDARGRPLADQPTPSQSCPSGSFREFNSVQDVHIGVLTSSVSDHGVSGGCGPGGGRPTGGRLVTRGVGSGPYRDLGFLAWDPVATKSPPGIADADELQDLLERAVRGVGENGCAFEAPLESWYRFLVDPDPPAELVPGPCPDDASRRCVEPRGIDQTLLDQRAAFLRPDSLLAIVMLTDENDCSIIDAGRNAEVLGNRVPPGTTACETDPTSLCCHPCDEPARSGCLDPGRDPRCQQGDVLGDPNLNLLRCFDQRRRFGKDFRYPIQRYVDALTQPMVPRRDGTLVPNPIFSGDPPRDPSLVYLAGIVGVPWQDLATDPSGAGPLVYRSAERMHADGTWRVVVGEPESGVAPLDPLMVESIEERTGIHPVTGEPVAPASSLDPNANSINGHEMSLGATSIDLQYACVFDLPMPRDCGGFAFCDCGGFGGVGGNASTSKKPICQAPDGTYGTVQFRAKAYPGVRQLQVLEGIGDNAIVASICARELDPASPDFGYRPALRSILDRLSEGIL